MPTISRIRIVNFSYNNGRRRIADETFSMFFDGSSQDTLLNLENGGGKSVLVQLMLQPVIPLCELNARRMQDYFSKSSDCAYILLEWKLDASEDFYLTGIAISPGESTEQTGDNLRFFTFTTQYGRFGDAEYDILHLALAEQDGTSIHFLSYRKGMELVKELSHRHPGKVHYFHSDDEEIYRRELEDFGISKSEWKRVIVPINNHEGGVKDLFEKLKTADKLIDEMLIETIDRSIDTSGLKDASLSQMILNYAQKTVDNEENILQKQQMDKFYNQLSSCREPANTLWKLSDRYELALSQIDGFAKRVAEKIAEADKASAGLFQQHSAAKEALQTLNLEEVSDRFYYAQKHLQGAQMQLDIARAEKEHARQAAETNQMSQKVQEAAGLAEQIRERQNRAAALREQIEAAEQDGTVAAKLNSLRYSVFQKASQEQTVLNEQKKSLRGRTAEWLEQAEQLRARQRQDGDKITQIRQDIAVNDDRCARFEKYTHELFSVLSLALLPNIMGEYDEKELSVASEDFARQIRAAQHAADENTAQAERLRFREKEQREQKTALLVEQEKLKFEQNSRNRKLKEYETLEQEAETILQGYDLAADAMFYAEKRLVMTEKQQEFRQREREAQGERETADRQLEALQCGALHLPPALLAELNELDIPYDTGENWLMNRTAEEQERVLSLFSELPYCILILEKDFERLQSETQLLWLNALGCFVSYATLDAVLQQKRPFSAGELITLSRCAKESFQARDIYEQKLQAQRENFTKQAELFRQQTARVTRDLAFFDAHSFLPEYHVELKQKAEAVQEAQLQNAVKLQELDGLTGKTIQESETRQKRQPELLNNLRQAQQRAEDFSQWQRAQQDALLWRRDQSQKRKQAGELQQALSARRTQQAELEEKINSAKGEQARLDQQLTEHDEWLHECIDAEKVPLLPGEALDLWQQYQQLQSGRNQTIQQLNERIQENQSTLARLQESLRLKKLPEAAYEGVFYSTKELERLKDEEEALSQSLDQKNENHEKALTMHGKLSSDFSRAKDELLKYSTEPVPMDMIRGNYTSRRAKALEIISGIETEQKGLEQRVNLLTNALKNARQHLSLHPYSGAETAVELEENADRQLDVFLQEFEEARADLSTATQDYRSQLARLDSDFSAQNKLFYAMIQPLEQKMNDLVQKQYDRYFEIDAMIENNLSVLEKSIALYDQELSEMAQNFENLVTHCFAHGKRIYEQLHRLCEASAVRLPELARKVHMLKIELPEQVDEEIAKERMKSYVENEAQRLAQAIRSEQPRSVLIKKAGGSVASRILLNTLLGKTAIPVKVFKIDMDMQNSDYRTWENAISANSGGEKFVVYFAVILSLMYYAKSYGGALQNKQTGTLIMDNPFGPISSEHLLKPMFAIARRFGMQLICLTDLDTADIVSCFALRYQIKINPVAYSGYSMVEFESGREAENNNEMMEHAYYKGAQMKLF